MLRLARVESAGSAVLAAATDDGVALLEEFGHSMVDLIEAGDDALEEVQAAVAKASTLRLALSEVRLLPPIDRFRRDLLCTGWNYLDHFEEGRGTQPGQEVALPGAPTFFTKGPDAVIGPYDPIAYDRRISAKWDYEAELVVIIGREGRSIGADVAMDYVWGYCLANDISQRDLQRRHGGQWLKGKSIDRSMPLGPWIVPACFLDPTGVRIQCEVNGRVMQDAIVSQMMFSVPELIAELSLGMTLRPGDVLLTGTPSGVGNVRTPPVYLAEGDEVVVRGTGIGELRNVLTTFDLYHQSTVEPFAKERVGSTTIADLKPS